MEGNFTSACTSDSLTMSLLVSSSSIEVDGSMLWFVMPAVSVSESFAESLVNAAASASTEKHQHVGNVTGHRYK